MEPVHGARAWSRAWKPVHGARAWSPCMEPVHGAVHGSDSAACVCFDWGSGAVLLGATYLRCSDIRQLFPWEVGFSH